MRKYVFAALAALILSACRQSDDASARRFLDAARASMENSDFAGAKILIDSVKIVYPKAFEARKEGIRLLQEVELAEADRTLAFQDSVILHLRERLDDVKKNFVFEKDAEYQDIGIYSVASQAVGKNYSRNYIRAQVDEKGRLTLVSNYNGSSYIHHRSIKLVSGDSYVESASSDNFYEFKDLEVCYEKCNIAGDDNGNLASFIAMNLENPVEVTLNGDRTVKYKMSAADKKAVKDVYSFSLLLSSMEEAVSIRDEALRKKRFVSENMARADSAVVSE